MASEESKLPEDRDTSEEEKVADGRASEAVGSVVLEDLERQYFISIDERESLKRQLADTESERNRLQELLLKQQEVNKTLNEANDRAELLEEKLKTAESKYADSQERMDRMQAENDKLRDELSQLNTKNTELAKQLASEQIKGKLTESEAIPLFHEKERLQTELDSVQSHASWLEQELEAKQKDCQRDQTQSRDRILQLQLQLNQTTDELAETQTKLSVLEKVEKDLQKKLSQLTNDNLSLKTEMQEYELAANKDLQDKERINELQKEHIARWKARCEDVQKENENLKETAQRAMEAGDHELQEVQQELDAKYTALLQEQKAHYEAKLSQAPLVNQALAITEGADENKSDDDGESGPFELTELLQRWEDTKRALRTERWNHGRLKKTYNRLVKEVRDKTPQLARQREEFEMAIERNEALEKRLKNALQEKEYALADAKDAQKEQSVMAKRLQRRGEEANYLARQVQALLAKQLGSDPTGEIPLSVQEIQSQNMKLLEEHRRLSQQVEELEGRLNSDTLKSELDTKSSEVERLVEEREQQEKIVEKIVQQRDLYRALVNRHDNEALGSESNELSMLDMVQKQSLKLQTLEKSNRSLEDRIQQAQDELESAVREKSIFEERCRRYEIANTELTSVADELQRKLLEAKSDGAKSLADATYHREKCARLEESLERCHSEISQLNKNRNDIQQNVASMESALAKATAAQASLESENRANESKLRLSETRLETEKATAARYAKDNSQLRDDIARHGAMIEHIRRIENSLLAKNATEMSSLKEQLSVAKDRIEGLESKHSTEITEIANKLSDSQGKVETLQLATTKHQNECLEAKKESLEAKTELQAAKTQLRKLEAQLRAAKRKLGEEADVDNVQLEMQQKIDNLESELNKAKSEVEALQEEVENYRGLAKTGETELSKTKKAAENFKSELQEEMNDLKKQVEQKNKEFESRSGLLKDLTADLASQREEREKVEHALKTEIQSLKEKIEADKALVDSTKASFESYKADITKYQTEVAQAQQNYERELAKHAEARTELRSAREATIEHQRVREEADQKLRTLQDEVASYKETYEAERVNLSNQIATLEKQVEESRDQNKLLHSQLESINSTMEKSKESGDSPDDNEGLESEQQKTIAELREIIKYLRSENEVCQTGLDAAKRAIDREKASTEVLRRSLDELRSELQTAQQQATGDGRAPDTEVVRQIEDKNHQLRVLNDSNRLLREDTERLTQKLKKVEQQLSVAKTATQPINDIKKELGENIKALESENASLRRELDSWKSRMNNLVKNLDQVDPEEHRKLTAQVEEMTKEKDSLNAWKSATENENKRIRSIATRMRKMNEEYQTTIDKQKTEISTLQAEREKLNKASSATTALVKERDDLKMKVSQVEKEKSSIKTELEGANTNANRLRESLRRFKERINSLEKELATRASSSESKPPKSNIAEAPPKVTKDDSAPAPPPVPIPKIPGEGFKFGPSANQALSNSSASDKGRVLSETRGPTKSIQNVPEQPGKRRLSGETKEMSMKEKLLMKKKKLEQEVQEGLKRKQALGEAEKAQKRSKVDNSNETADATTASSSNAGRPPETDEKPKIEDLKPTSDTLKLSVAQEKTKTEISKETVDAKTQPAVDDSKSIGKTSAKTENTSEESDKKTIETVDIKPASSDKTTADAPSAITAPIFGQTQSLRPSAPSFTPVFGAPSSSTSFGSFTSPFGKSSEGAFLDHMKPPGNSGVTPMFSFGSKSNITLPTPTVPQSPSPFGADFRSASSSSLGASKPLFGNAPSDAEPKDDKDSDDKVEE